MHSPIEASVEIGLNPMLPQTFRVRRVRRETPDTFTLEIEAAKIVPPTSQNQKIIENDLKVFVSKYLDLPSEKLTWQCEQAISQPRSPYLEEQTWNFDVLQIRDTRNAAASAARKSDLVG